MMDVSVEIHCGTCGSANYELPEGVADEAAVLCNDCGMCLATVAQLKAEMMEQAIVRSAEALRRELGRLSGGNPA